MSKSDSRHSHFFKPLTTKENQKTETTSDNVFILNLKYIYIQSSHDQIYLISDMEIRDSESQIFMVSDSWSTEYINLPHINTNYSLSKEQCGDII